MRHWTFWSACAVVLCLNLSVHAQTTDTTAAPTTTTTRSGASSGSSIGTGAGIGTTDTNGASFSGGQGMTGGGSFTGGSAFIGGQPGTTGSGRGTTTTTGPSTSNPFRASYGNVYAKGAGSTKTFGQPIFATVTTTPAGGQASGLGRGRATGSVGVAGSESTGFSTVGIRRAPAYSTTLGPGLPIINVAPPMLLGELRATLEATTALPSKNGIQIAVEGSTVVLRGRVENDRERRLAEGIIRLTPGVREIRNELVAP